MDILCFYSINICDSQTLIFATISVVSVCTMEVWNGDQMLNVQQPLKRSRLECLAKCGFGGHLILPCHKPITHSLSPFRLADVHLIGFNSGGVMGISL